MILNMRAMILSAIYFILLLHQSQINSQSIKNILKEHKHHEHHENSTNINKKRPCWCDDLMRIINYTTTLLTERYGKENLDAAATYSTFGNHNKLNKRLHYSLQHRKPFRLGLIGGSYTLPIYTGNSWFFNVSRWMNTVLSSSDCSNRNDKPVIESSLQQNCKFEHILDVNHDMCPNRNISNFYKGKYSAATFCTNIDYNNIVKNYKLYASKNSRPLETICDNLVKPYRLCTVYEGSGKYVFSTIGGKGGTPTSSSLHSLQSTLNPKEKFHMIFWDYSINDGLSDHEHEIFAKGQFFDTLLLHHTNLAAIGVVYWFDKGKIANMNCKNGKKPTEYFTGDIAAIHYVGLKNLFHSNHGAFRNLSLVTMSLPGFCSIEPGCQPNDFLNPTTGHASDNGVSFFADLIIWQFLRHFNYIIKTNCFRANNNNNSSKNNKFDDTTLSKVFNNFNWTVDNNLNLTNYKLQHSNTYKEIINYFKKDESRHRKVDSPIIAILNFDTPVLSNPIDIDLVALLCSPSIFLEPSHYVFDDTLPLEIGPLKFVKFDIYYALADKCAGWIHGDKRGSGRFDDDHLFSPTLTRNCYNHTRCENKYGKRYPKTTWRDLPTGLVKMVDILLRVKVTFDWNEICQSRANNAFLLFNNTNNNNNNIISNNSNNKNNWKIVELVGNHIGCFKNTEKKYINEYYNNTYYYIWFDSAKAFVWNDKITQSRVDTDQPIYFK